MVRSDRRETHCGGTEDIEYSIHHAGLKHVRYVVGVGKIYDNKFKTKRPLRMSVSRLIELGRYAEGIAKVRRRYTEGTPKVHRKVHLMYTEGTPTSGTVRQVHPPPLSSEIYLKARFFTVLQPLWDCTHVYFETNHLDLAWDNSGVVSKRVKLNPLITSPTFVLGQIT